MADRYCPSCGTEVDAEARFCPACGQTLSDLEPGEEPTIAIRRPASGDPAEQDASAIPPAPGWPAAQEPASAPTPDEPAAAARPEPPAEPPPPPSAPAPGQPAESDDLPITLPTMLSGWLIGVGSGLAALALLPRLGSVLNVLLFVSLLGISATVFLADRMPRFAHLRLATLMIVMIALGAALDRAAFTVRGADTIFLITIMAAAGGVLLIELDRDRPMPPNGGRA